MPVNTEVTAAMSKLCDNGAACHASSFRPTTRKHRLRGAWRHCSPIAGRESSRSFVV